MRDCRRRRYSMPPDAATRVGFKLDNLRTLQRRFRDCHALRGGARGVLCAVSPLGRAEPAGLHGHAFARGDDCRGGVRALGVPLRVDVLELGVGESRRSRRTRWDCGSAVAPARGTGGTTHGQPCGGHPRTGVEPGAGADPAVSRNAGAIRFSRLETRQAARTRTGT